MRLLTAQVRLFRNIVDSGSVTLQPDVTCLLGKNESGKTAFMQALYSLNPAHDSGLGLDVKSDYPRWRKTRDGREVELQAVVPIRASFEMNADEILELSEALAMPLPSRLTLTAGRDYAGAMHIHLDLCDRDLIAMLTRSANLEGAIRQGATACRNPAELAAFARDELSRVSKEDRESVKSLRALAASAAAGAELLASGLDGKAKQAVLARLPRFFYFSDYSALQGRTDLTELLAKAKRNPSKLEEHEHTAMSLLRLAGAAADELLEDDFESRMIELEAAANELSSEVFKYWTQNRDVRVSLISDAAPVSTGRKDLSIHRFLDVRLHDLRHQVTTNLENRSPGFRWFFSFVTAFAEFEREDNVVILLDEPGRGLHARAQCDLLRYIDERVAASNQIVYTTHSPFMLSPELPERLRVVEDLTTQEDQDVGTRISADLSTASDDTLLPLEAASRLAGSAEMPVTHRAITLPAQESGQEGGLDPEQSKRTIHLTVPPSDEPAPSLPVPLRPENEAAAEDGSEGEDPRSA